MIAYTNKVRAEVRRRCEAAGVEVTDRKIDDMIAYVLEHDVPTSVTARVLKWGVPMTTEPPIDPDAELACDHCGHESQGNAFHAIMRGHGQLCAACETELHGISGKPVEAR